MNEHQLYKTGDADVPDSIKDRNGEVALSCCRKCGRGESELAAEPCMPRSPLDVLAPESCLCGYGECCVCPDTERALRRVIAGMPITMTPAQREWCLTEIDRVEGYDRADFQNDEDQDLARVVMSAWTDYARDKGLM